MSASRVFSGWAPFRAVALNHLIFKQNIPVQHRLYDGVFLWRLGYHLLHLAFVRCAYVRGRWKSATKVLSPFVRRLR